MSTPPVQPAQILRGIVKQVLSGDSIVIRGQPKGGPPPEKTVSLSGVIAPRLARRPGGPNSKAEDAKDEPYAWESREFLRKKIIGKEVLFVKEYQVTSGREFGVLYVGKDTETGENITELLVNEGLVNVKKDSKSENTRLLDLESTAKAAKKGKWSDDGQSHVRDIVWQVDSPKALLEKFGRKPIAAVVEHVRDGSTVRVFLLPTFHYVTVLMSGIRAPGVKLDQDGRPTSEAEPFRDEALFFTESRLLNRDVEVILEADQGLNFIGSVIHPNGNLAELLLRDGYAKCVDWSMGLVTGGAEKLRAAESFAREKKLRRWKDYQAPTSAGSALMKGKEKEFSAVVVEVNNGDALMVKTNDGTVKKIFIAGIKPPRLEDDKEKTDAAPAQKPAKDNKAPFRPLYDVPYMFEAREFLRKRLIGKKVQVTLDYIQAASQLQDASGASRQLAEKMCCTVKEQGQNIGEALLSRGLGKVVMYRQDNDQRASEYDALLAAEAKAKKEQKGLFSPKRDSLPPVNDISADATKAKQFLPFYQRAGRTLAVAEFISSGSRMRLYLPREHRLITFLLGGISCPRAPRLIGDGKDGDPFGAAALSFTRELCLQKEVEIDIDSIDKLGSFIGFLFVNGRNLSELLVEEGLATVHFSAEKTAYHRQLQAAENIAKTRRLKIWENFVESTDEVKPEDDKPDRKVDQKVVIVTEVTPELHVFVQFADDGDKLENLMGELKKELGENPPVAGNYNPKRGDLCVAKYSADNEWYRAKVEKVSPAGEVNVLFIDYGNREVVKAGQCSQLPAVTGASAGAYAREYALACVSLPSDEEYSQDAITALRQDTAEGRFLLNVEYKGGSVDHITLVEESSKEDIGERLVKEGLFLVENRKERRLQQLVKTYKAAEAEAKKKHNNIWRYGDITEDDAREFGIGKRA